MMNVLRENGLQFDPSSTLAEKSIMQMTAINSVLFAGSNLMEQGIDTIRELALEQVTAENMTEMLKKGFPTRCARSRASFALCKKRP